jgi:hypothetical protein
MTNKFKPNPDLYTKLSTPQRGALWGTWRARLRQRGGRWGWRLRWRCSAVSKPYFTDSDLHTIHALLSGAQPEGMTAHERARAERAERKAKRAGRAAARE